MSGTRKNKIVVHQWGFGPFLGKLKDDEALNDLARTSSYRDSLQECRC
jgi:hypothetical protein